MATPERPGWYVVCEGYWRGPFKTEAEAERQKGLIEALGTCWYEHRIKEVTR
jgi:hypothetical protein